jgi:addiction module RelB/DinJ family antitoxin
MATKTANVLARVEPSVKEKAEAIMSQLGIPASVVINMLYKQIILKQAIPFPLSVSNAPMSRDEMSVQDFDEIMQRGLSEAVTSISRPASDVFADLRKKIKA